MPILYENAMTGYEYIKENLKRIENELAEAAAAAGRLTPTLIAVTKSASDDEVLALAEAGVVNVGENRTSMLTARKALLEGAGFSPRMHLIGSLQTNKAKEIVGKTALIHSLDRPSLAATLERLADRNGIVIDTLAEINIGREEAKGGLLVEDAEAFCRSLAEYPHLRLRGLMTMAPAGSSSEEYAEYFSAVRELSERLAAEGLFFGEDAPLLSMGMSGSYREAAAAGASFVRVGRTLFAH